MKEETQKRFAEHEQKLRQEAISLLRLNQTENMGADMKSTMDSKPETDSMEEKVQQALEKARLEASKMSISSQPKPQAKQEAKSAKPAWAMTEEAASAKENDDDFELEDDEGLLEFAEGLDYDRYINDIEVKTMIDKLQKRIGDLQKEVEVDDQRNAAAEIRAAKREMLALMVS